MAKLVSAPKTGDRGLWFSCYHGIMEREDLGMGPKVLLCYLIADQDNRLRYPPAKRPSHRTLAAALGTDRPRIQEWLTRLEEGGLISVDRAHGKNQVDRYRVLWPENSATGIAYGSETLPQDRENVATPRLENVAAVWSGNVATPRGTLDSSDSQILSDSDELEKNEARGESPPGLVRLRERWSRRAATG
jgi:DNA-binding transcriptional MocR family regulator